MLKRSLILSIALAVLWAAPSSAATSRHVFVELSDVELCLVLDSQTWTPHAGQATLRLTFIDLTTGGTESFDTSVGPTDGGRETENLAGDTGSVGLGHVWRLNALLLDGSDNVLAKGTSRRATIDCQIDA